MALEFYLREILDSPINDWLGAAGNATNYSGLVDQLGRFSAMASAMLVTFNYDQMIERALDSVLGWRINHIRDYLKRDVALIRPHGSVNWKQDIHPGVSRESKSHAGTIEAAGRGPVEHYGIDFGWTDYGSELPAIAIPVDRGKTFVCPADHLDRLSADLGKVTRILVVGWRAAEQHFLGLLREKLRKNHPVSLCIVDWRESARAVYNSLESALSPAVRFRPLELHDRGFSEFVTTCMVRDWLSMPAESY